MIEFVNGCLGDFHAWKRGRIGLHLGKPSRKGDLTQTAKFQLGGRDVVRTYRDGKRLGWHVPGKEILLHIVICEKECLQLDIQLDSLFGMISAYQKQAA